MRTKQALLVGRTTIRLQPAVLNAIQKSGQSRPEWLRQAAQARIEKERGQDPDSRMETRVKGLKLHVDGLQATLGEIQREIGKLHRHALGFQALPDSVVTKLQNLDRILATALFNLVPTLLDAMEGRLGEIAHEKARAERSVLPERFRGPVRERDEL